MQIHIWQQFSSNHSADFTVVGEFETPEAAQKAANEIRSMLRAIMAWHLENPNAYDWQDESLRPASPPEQEFAQKYGVKWEFLLDWVKREAQFIHEETESNNGAAEQKPAKYSLQTLTELDEASTEPVEVVDRCVFVSPSSETWNGPFPFNDIIAKLGGKVSYDVEYGGYESHFHITVQVPSTEVADHIKMELIKQQEPHAELERKIASGQRVFTRNDFQSDTHKYFLYLTAIPTFELDENVLKIKGLNFGASEHEFKILLDWLEKQGAKVIEYETEAVEEQQTVVNREPSFGIFQLFFRKFGKMLQWFRQLSRKNHTSE